MPTEVVLTTKSTLLSREAKAWLVNASKDKMLFGKVSLRSSTRKAMTVSNEEVSIYLANRFRTSLYFKKENLIEVRSWKSSRSFVAGPQMAN